MKFFKTGLVVAATIFAAGCSDSSRVNTPPAPDVPPAPPTTFTLQAVHASSNAPAVNINVNGGLAYGNVDYKESPTPVALEAGTYDLAVDAILPDGSVLPNVIEAPGQAFDALNTYTVFAIGNVGDTGDTALQPKVVVRPATVVPSDTVNVYALHAAAGAPPVNIFVTEPGADISMGDGQVNIDPVPFGADALGPLPVPAGDYQIRITVASDATNTPVFDTGTVSLTGGTSPIVAAVDNTTAGSASPVSALVVTTTGVAEILDAGTGADVRVTHAVPDVGVPNDPTDGAVDVYANMAQVAALDSLLYTETRGPLTLPADDYAFQVAPAGTMNFVINPDGDAIPLAAGSYYDAIAIGSVAGMDLDLFAGTDDRRRLATAAKVRIIHGSASAGPVDIYVGPIGTTTIDGLEPFMGLENIPLGADTGYIQVDAGQYQVLVTPTGTSTVAISAGIDVAAAGLYTIVARDPIAPSAELGVLSLDDDPTP